MGKPKHKWTQEEEEALSAGVAKHGTGKWSNIQKDPEFNPHLYSRSNVDLKDKWRNMSVSASGQGPKEKAGTPKLKGADSPATPMLNSQASGSSSVAIVLANAVPTDVITKDSSKSLLDGKPGLKYNALIYEALSTLKDPNGTDTSAIVSFIQQRHALPPNSRRIIISSLSRLVRQEKLEKVQDCYRLRREGLNGTRDTIPKPKEIRPRLSQMNSHFGETLEENQSFVAAEALKDLERVIRMAKEAEAFLQLVYERWVTA